MEVSSFISMMFYEKNEMLERNGLTLLGDLILMQMYLIPMQICQITVGHYTQSAVNGTNSVINLLSYLSKYA